MSADYTLSQKAKLFSRFQSNDCYSVEATGFSKVTDAHLWHANFFPTTQPIHEHSCGCPENFFRHSNSLAIVTSATSLDQCSIMYLALYGIFLGEKRLRKHCIFCKSRYFSKIQRNTNFYKMLTQNLKKA